MQKLVNPKTPRFVITAALLGAAALAIALDQAIWWLLLISGSAVGLGSTQSVSDNRRPYLLFAVSGMCLGLVIEAGRLAFSLWPYAAPFDTLFAVGLLITIGYPLLLLVTVRLHARIRRHKNAVSAFLLTLLGVVLLNEPPNALSPLWEVPEGRSGLILSLFAVGYLFEVCIAIILWSFLTHLHRQSGEDSLFWRATRAAILSVLRDTMHQVLQARGLGDASPARRLLRPEIEKLADEIEPMASRLRSEAQLSRLPGIGNRLMVELAVFTSAAYRVLLAHGIRAQEARKIVADAGWVIYARMLALAALPSQMISKDPGTRLRRTIQRLLIFPFHAPGVPGYAVTSRVVDGDLQTHFTHCPPQSFVRNLIASDDQGDLEAFRESWCQYDWPGADVIAGDEQRGHYTRRRTLSQGDSVCDMCWRAKPTAPNAPDEAPVRTGTEGNSP